MLFVMACAWQRLHQRLTTTAAQRAMADACARSEMLRVLASVY